MSATGNIALTPIPLRRIPSRVQLSPQVANGIFAHLGLGKAVSKPRIPRSGNFGILFGDAERDVVTVRAFRPLAADVLETNRLVPAFKELFAAAKMEPALENLSLIGWLRVVRTSDLTLLDSDIEFHNSCFRRATDVALLLKSERNVSVSLTLYTKSAARPLSRQDHLSGSLHMDAQATDGALDVTMWRAIDNYRYLRTFQVLDSLERVEKGVAKGRIVLLVTRLAPYLAGRLKHPFASGNHNPDRTRSELPREPMIRPGGISPVASPEPEGALPVRFVHPSVATVASSGHSVRFSDVSALPTKRAHTKVLWISSAMLTLIAAGVTFAWLHSRTRMSQLAVEAPGSKLSAGTRLGLQVKSQSGSLLVGWNSAAAQSAKRGVLQIHDASDYKEIHLDPRQIANGSVVYTPSSKDVIFRLEVLNEHGLPVRETVRVIDGSDSISTARLASSAQPNTSPPRPSQGRRATRTASNTTSDENVISQSRGENSSDLGLRRAEMAAPPDLPNSLALRLGTGILSPPPSRALRIPAASLFPAYVPARPTKQVMPNTKILGSSLVHAPADVRVAVRIDDSGRVSAASVIAAGSKSASPFESVALAASKEWIFEPAKRHGTSVPSDYTIEFHFVRK